MIQCGCAGAVPCCAVLCCAVPCLAGRRVPERHWFDWVHQSIAFPGETTVCSVLRRAIDVELAHTSHAAAIERHSEWQRTKHAANERLLFQVEHVSEQPGIPDVKGFLSVPSALCVAEALCD